MSLSRRAALRLGAAGIVASIAGCASGVLDEESSDSGETTTRGPTPEAGTDTEPTNDTETADEPTTHVLAVQDSLPEGTTEFPDGPKSRPERPDDLSVERVREYVRTFEYRRVYNRLHGDGTEVRAECGVDSVAEYGVGYRVVVWCSAWANAERNGTTYHADYFTRYATYFVGSDSAVRRDGRPAG